MTRPAVLLAAFLVLLTALPAAAQSTDTSPAVRVGVVKQPYLGARNVPEISLNPDYIHGAGLEGLIESWGGEVVGPIRNVRLTADQQRDYGAWHRLGMANGHLAEAVAEQFADDLLTVALEGNCSSLAGVLGGLQRGTDGEMRRVGLVFIDAHGDFNTPETTLSGMLGGMPVAVAAGHALERLRLESGLEQPIPMEHIVWGAVRDLDPLEADRFREYDVRQISVDDIRQVSDHLKAEMDRLAAETDVIYVHIDMDALDPADVPGHSLNVPNGPTGVELGAALTEMFKRPSVAALGIASTPAGSADPMGVSRAAALELIKGAIQGARARGR